MCYSVNVNPGEKLKIRSLEAVDRLMTDRHAKAARGLSRLQTLDTRWLELTSRQVLNYADVGTGRLT